MGAAFLPLLDGSTNCGGNSAALSAVRAYARFALNEAMVDTGHGFRVTEATAEQRDQLASLPGAGWLPRAHFLVSSAPVLADSKKRRVVIVCDRPFTNVPRRWMGSAPPAHAAGFSDGTARLISPTEFAGLDWSSFVKVDDLLRESGSLSPVP